MPQQAALYRRLTVDENLRLFARLEEVDDARRRSSEMLELTGLGERRDDSGRAALGRQPAADQHRDRPALAARGAAARRALVGLDPRQRARLWEFVSGLAGARHHGDLLDPRHPGGRALRAAAARPRRRRGALRRLGRRSFARPSRREAPEAADRDFETAFVAFLQHRGH